LWGQGFGLAAGLLPGVGMMRIRFRVMRAKRGTEHFFDVSGPLNVPTTQSFSSRLRVAKTPPITMQFSSHKYFQKSTSCFQ